jgi:hypothetical protein
MTDHRQSPLDDEYFGFCPECHTRDGHTNVGKSHWFYCVVHKKRWWGGSNVLSTWQQETEAEQRAAWAMIGTFEVVSADNEHYDDPPPAVDYDSDIPF